MQSRISIFLVYKSTDYAVMMTPVEELNSREEDDCYFTTEILSQTMKLQLKEPIYYSKVLSENDYCYD